jgi:hypothetical protein
VIDVIDRVPGLAGAHGEHLAYAHFRDRYRDMATTLDFEGHIDWDKHELASGRSDLHAGVSRSPSRKIMSHSSCRNKLMTCNG